MREGERENGREGEKQGMNGGGGWKHNIVMARGTPAASQWHIPPCSDYTYGCFKRVRLCPASQWHLPPCLDYTYGCFKRACLCPASQWRIPPCLDYTYGCFKRSCLCPPKGLLEKTEHQHTFEQNVVIVSANHC